MYLTLWYTFVVLLIQISQKIMLCVFLIRSQNLMIIQSPLLHECLYSSCLPAQWYSVQLQSFSLHTKLSYCKRVWQPCLFTALSVHSCLAPTLSSQLHLSIAVCISCDDNLLSITGGHGVVISKWSAHSTHAAV